VDHFVNVDQLYSLIEPHSTRIELADVVDIPSTYLFWDVEITPEQARVYKQLKDNATAALEEEGHVTATMVLVRMLRLHQVLMGHVVDEEGVERVLKERRSSALLELLDTHYQSGKVVIWFSYDYDIRKVAALLRKEKGPEAVACFWGGNTSVREEEDRRFREDPGCLFMLATPGAGGRGRKWDVADMVVYYSSTDNLEHRDQSEERVKSVSSPRPKAYFDLRVPGTVDEKIIKALRKKINLAAAITGDDFREWLV
jgi:SNF2 family DNA or RNA helicase